MKIIKHGKYYSANNCHVDLVGECECGCKFETFVDVYFDVPNKYGITFVTDKDCTSMKIEPKFVYGDPQWIGSTYATRYDTRAIRTVSYHYECPECRDVVELSVKGETMHHGNEG